LAGFCNKDWGPVLHGSDGPGTIEVEVEVEAVVGIMVVVDFINTGEDGRGSTYCSEDVRAASRTTSFSTIRRFNVVFSSDS
jgi:hypothetical protein